jgi:hypothetical protein
MDVVDTNLDSGRSIPSFAWEPQEAFSHAQQNFD